MKLSRHLALALLAGAPDGEWARVEPDLELVFPADHGAHPEYESEWWYLTGQVADANGRRFGFQFTIFRAGMDPDPAQPDASPLRARQVWAGHLAVCDVAGGRTLLAERLRRGGSPLAHGAAGDLDLVLEDWSLSREAGDRLVLSAHDAARGIGLELELEPSKPLVFQGPGGYSSKGGEAGNASAYVSWSRLATSGRLSLDGEAHAVQGEAWFDHEFGSSVLGEGIVGWDWFGLQLEDGRELMAFGLRRADGSAAPGSAATLVARDGSPRHLVHGEFEIEALSTWTSPRTGTRYPAGWRIELPAEGLSLDVTPLVADAELVTTASTDVSYWEGPVEVNGTVGGRGYAELTGYDGSMSGRF